jgi:hypothetical protein
MKPLAIAAVAAALAVAALGCGGAEGDPSAAAKSSPTSKPGVEPPSVLSKPKYLARANAICRRRWRFVLNAVRQTSVLWRKQYPHIDSRVNYARAVRVSYFSSLNFLIFDSVDYLGQPLSDRRASDEVLNAMQEAIERGVDDTRIRSVGQLRALFVDYNRKARRFGLDKCLVGGSRLPHPEA